MNSYELAKAEYAKYGVDTEKAIETLSKTEISMHCWQGDDVHGFAPSQDAMAIEER